MNDLNDARRVFGFGVTFLLYAAWLAYEAIQHRRRVRDETRARLIHDGAEQRRETLIRQERMEP